MGVPRYPEDNFQYRGTTAARHFLKEACLWMPQLSGSEGAVWFRTMKTNSGFDLGWWVRGLAQPTPFFDVSTRAPRSQPLALTPGERGAL
jgi:hypothetical protein